MARITFADISLNVTERGAGVPLLLVHGFPLDHTMWSAQIDALSRQNRVIAPDLRGFGNSDVTPGTVTMAQYADDLAQLLDAMQVREPVVFCGLSMGGYVGWQFWDRHRQRLAKLILCDTRAVADTAEGAAARLQTAEKVLAEGPQVVAESMLPKLFAPESIEQQKPFVEATRSVMLKTHPDGMAAALRGMAERPDFTPRLPQIDVPTLVLGGQHDPISTPQEMEQIAAAIPGATFVQIAGAGHMSPLEQPSAVNSKIGAFVAN
ncbi:MAG TPA: alpha/beta fold hydrolase [Pirellulaceae bacterium]|nr:alpha/beta fold hydrolase [Pirellulaceae bacterium]